MRSTGKERVQGPENKVGSKVKDAGCDLLLVQPLSPPHTHITKRGQRTSLRHQATIILTTGCRRHQMFTACSQSVSCSAWFERTRLTASTPWGEGGVVAVVRGCDMASVPQGVGTHGDVSLTYLQSVQNAQESVKAPYKIIPEERDVPLVRGGGLGPQNIPTEEQDSTPVSSCQQLWSAASST